MFFSGDYQVKEYRMSYVVSVIGENNSVRIPKELVDAEDLKDETEIVAIILAVIEIQRINEKALKNRTTHLIKDEDVLGKINYMIETRRISIDQVILKLSQMKYFEMKKFFYEEFEKKFFSEEDYI